MKGRRYLLDTHIFIWNVTNKRELSYQVCNELDDLNNVLYISMVSLMEIAIKNKSGKLSLKKDYATLFGALDHMGIKILDINKRHLNTYDHLICEKNHKDPYDHMIIAQAITERLCLISADGKMSHYIPQGLDLLQAIKNKTR